MTKTAETTSTTKTCAHCGAKPKPKRKPARRRKPAPKQVSGQARRTAKKEKPEMTNKQLGLMIYAAAVAAIFAASFFVPAAPPG